MPSLLPRTQQQDAPTTNFALPVLLVTTYAIANLCDPVRHTLLINAIAWIFIWGYSAQRGRRKGLTSAVTAQRASWVAGGLLALSQSCQRVVEGNGTLWANALLPLFIYFGLRSIAPPIASSAASPAQAVDKARTPQLQRPFGSMSAVCFLSCSAVTAMFTSHMSNGTIVIGLSYAVSISLALLLLDRAVVETQSGAQSGETVIYSANGLLSQASRPTRQPANSLVVVMRDVSFAAAIATTLACVSFEDFTFGGLQYWGVIGQLMGEKWLLWQHLVGVMFSIAMVAVHVVMFWTLLMTVQRQGSITMSFLPLWAAIFTQLPIDLALDRLWFAFLCSVWTYDFFAGNGTSSTTGKRSRFNRTLMLVTVVSLVALVIMWLKEPYERVRSSLNVEKSFSNQLQPLPPVEPLAPLRFDNAHEHPVSQLINDADTAWQQLLHGQSQTLEAAVAEYRRRYGIPPPPHFDKWYEMAKSKNVQLIDEYDTIYKTVLPFWGVSPATIRARAREAIGYSDNMLMGLALRDGKASVVHGGPDWLQQAAVGMIEDFVRYLPDMDLAFNTHDEPRVVVPHDDLSRLVEIALNENMPAALSNDMPRNAFSPRPEDINDGRRFAECRTTRFNWYAHQPVWDPSRLSCPADSPARSLDEAFAADNLTAYALGELGFVYNQTAFSDICNSPSLSKTFGFFDRPNAFNTVHDLFPIFSQSKISSFNDILYPSPWYWYGKVAYQDWKDFNWKDKIPAMLWRGSTTGGFSRDGGWRRQHRQHMVQKVNALDNAKILETTTDDGDMRQYQVKEVPRQDHKNLMDVHFSHVGQCDPGDCAAQREFFQMANGIDQQAHWKWRYLLDMDGNAFSGRFYAFLKSRSLIFKMAIFREWHQEWLKPWVHYVPLSLRGEEVLESVRFFSSSAEGGEQLGIKVAEQGREWANKLLRNEDFELWFFRLLLEYGRVIDDNRAEIGYSGP